MHRDVLAAVALGLGAGLPFAELVETDSADVTTGPAGVVLVRVDAPRARAVPVRARYARLVLSLAEDAGDGPLFRPGAPGRVGKNALSNLVAKARAGAGPGLPRLTPQRMRATWLVRHLSAGVRADAVMRAAGPDDLGSLDRYLRWVEPADDAVAETMLAGSAR